MILDLPPEYFSHLTDGALDIWIDPALSRRQERWIFQALELTDYEVNQVKRRKQSDFRIFEVDVVDSDRPNVAGRAHLYPNKDLVTLKIKVFGINKLDRFILNHEIGHALGLAHQFDTPVGDTVMNYPNYDEITSGEAATRLTTNDLNDITNFSKAILNGDDPITGQHYCTSECHHQAPSGCGLLLL